MYASMHVCMHACMHAWMYVCMYVCMFGKGLLWHSMCKVEESGVYSVLMIDLFVAGIQSFQSDNRTVYWDSCYHCNFLSYLDFLVRRTWWLS